MITQADLQKILKYNPDTGEFTWLVSRGNVTVGSPAGTKDTSGHIKIGINGIRYMAHRLVFLYMFGELPIGIVDHIDKNPSNNALSNLREVHFAENQKNRKDSTKIQSGFTYITYKEEKEAWRVELGANCGRKPIGYYKNLDLAIKALEEALIEYNDSDSIMKLFYKQLSIYNKKDT